MSNHTEVLEKTESQGEYVPAPSMPSWCEEGGYQTCYAMIQNFLFIKWEKIPVR